MIDRTAIVTGGTGALGRHIVHKLVNEGIKVYIPSKTLEEFNEVFDAFLKRESKEFKLKTLYSFECDAVSESSVIDFVNNVKSRENGRIDYLVNTVGGIDGSADIMNISNHSLDNMINLNLKSTFYFTREVLKYMKEINFGRIISIGAMAGLEPSPGRFTYSFTKAAVINMMDTVSQEMKDYNIRCNSVIPSIIDTPANRQWGTEEEIKRWVKPEEVAEIIYNFLSVELSAVRESHIKVYGAY